MDKSDFLFPKKPFENFIKKSFQLRRIGTKSYHIEGFPIPNAQLPAQISKNRVFLIGDAAGLVDPVSGKGIHYALRSSKIVADTILKDYDTLLHDKIDSFYLKNIEHAILADLFVSYKLNHLLERFFLHNMEFWFDIMKKNPFIFKYIPELAKNGNYYDVYKDVLKNLPKIALNTMYAYSKIPGFQYKEKIFN